MPYKKYVKKATRAGARYAKKRYTTRTGGARVKALARDVYKIQRALNVEHKNIDYQIGQNGQIVSQQPTKTTPIIIPLNTPVRGTSFNNRVGNQLKVTHITAKYQFTFHNNTDLIQRQNVRARIIFARNANDVPDITQLLDTDSNGHYTQLSFINTQEYKKFVWMKSLDTRCSYTQPTNRYPASNGDGFVPDPMDPATPLAVTNPARQALNLANFFKRAETKCAITIKFQNLSDEVEMMKPYLVLTSDILEAAPDPFDYVSVSANLRMTYVDN